MTSRDDELWARVNEALDAREDPLSDRAVVDLVRERPERAAKVESLTRALEAIGTSAFPLAQQKLGAPTLHQRGDPEVPRRTSSGGRIVGAAAAAVLAIAALSYWAATRPAAPSPAAPALRARAVVKAFPTGASPVASWSVRVERREAALTTSDSLGSDGAGTKDTSTVESNAGSARIVVHSLARLP